MMLDTPEKFRLVCADVPVQGFPLISPGISDLQALQ
jgi:hypothetical protein